MKKTVLTLVGVFFFLFIFGCTTNDNSNDGGKLVNNLDVNGFPVNYAACMQFPEDINKGLNVTKNDFKCEILVSKDSNLFGKCPAEFVSYMTYDYVGGGGIEYFCNINYYNPSFVFSKSYSECSKIIGVDPNFCVFDIRTQAAKDKGVASQLIQKCIDLNGISFDGNECMLSFNPVKSDCDLIEDSNKQFACYYVVSFKTDDVSICDEFKSGDEKNSCFARVKKDPSFCENVVEKDSKDWCFVYSK